MNFFIKYFSLIFIILNALSSLGKGNFLFIKGKVLNSENQIISTSSVTVYNKGIIERVIIADKNGNFEAKLPIDNRFKLLITSVGYVSSAYEVNTDVDNSYVVNQSFFLTVVLVNPTNKANIKPFRLIGEVKFVPKDSEFKFSSFKIQDDIIENVTIINPKSKIDTLKPKNKIEQVKINPLPKDQNLEVVNKGATKDLEQKLVNPFQYNYSGVTTFFYEERLQDKEAEKLAQFNKQQFKYYDDNKYIISQSKNPLNSLLDIITQSEKNNRKLK